MSRPAQQRFLAQPHHLGVPRTLVIITEEMKHAVDEKVLQLVRDIVPGFASLALRGRKGDHDLANLGDSRSDNEACVVIKAEGQYVGRAVFAAKTAVEAAYSGVACNHDAH